MSFLSKDREREAGRVRGSEGGQRVLKSWEPLWYSNVSLRYRPMLRVCWRIRTGLQRRCRARRASWPRRQTTATVCWILPSPSCRTWPHSHRLSPTSHSPPPRRPHRRAPCRPTWQPCLYHPAPQLSLHSLPTTTPRPQGPVALMAEVVWTRRSAIPTLRRSPSPPHRVFRCSSRPRLRSNCPRVRARRTPISLRLRSAINQ